MATDIFTVFLKALDASFGVHHRKLCCLWITVLLICKVCHLYGTKFACYSPNCMRVTPSTSTGHS